MSRVLRMDKNGGLVMSENVFLGNVIKAARLMGWHVAHFRPGMTRRGRWVTPVQGDGAGWPDVVLIHQKKRRLIVAELKTETGKLTDKQQRWLELWRLIPCAEVFVLRPSMFDEFWEELKR